MKLLVVSHACATPINQQFFSEVERVSGAEITLVAPAVWIDDYGTKRFLERWPTFHGHLIPVPVWFNGNVPLHIYRSIFRNILKEFQPDAIYMHHEPYAAATAQVYTANRLWHGCPIGFFTWQNIQKTYPVPFKQTERMVYRQSTFACTGSESAKEVLRSKGYDGPCTLLPGSVNPDVHFPYPHTDVLRTKLGISPSEFIFGFMGRVSEVKGLHTTLRALTGLKEIPWRFVIVGEGAYSNKIMSLASSLGISDRVILTGYVPHTEAPTYLSLFDALLLPSETQLNWKEQFGRVLIEALACGTPVIGSDSGEIPNVIRRTGGGISFPEGNVSAFRSALHKMAVNDNLRHLSVKRGRECVLRNYTNEALARRFAETVKGAINASTTATVSRPYYQATA